MNNNSCNNNIIFYNDTTLVTHNMPKKITKKESCDEKLLYLNYNGLIDKDCKKTKTPCNKVAKTYKQFYRVNNNDCESDSDSDCRSLISVSSWESFDSCDDNDKLLENEIIRARVRYKEYYNKCC